MCLSNFKAIRQFKVPISWLRDLTSSYEKTSFRILRRGPGGQICGPKWGFQNFLKKLLAQFISYLAFILMGWVSWSRYIFVFLVSFSALWWPNIWPKMGFPELFGKTIGSIHFIPGIYPYGLSLLTRIHFRVPSLIFGPLVAKYLAENGVSGWGG